MQFADYTKRLLALAEVLHRWTGALGALDGRRREKVAHFADNIAATLSRAAEAAEHLERAPKDKTVARALRREFGRISGYVETMVGVLQHHLDGRKLAGVKRRLEQLDPDAAGTMPWPSEAIARIDRLVAAEGYFRALADSLRT